ncbi:MAG: tyrosine-type recombinase/integrase [Gammaproteobacteria bacterium]
MPLVAQHLAYCEHNRSRSPHTIRQKRVALGHLTTFLAEVYDVDPQDEPGLLLAADLPELLGWQRWMRGQVSENTLVCYTGAVRVFYRWAAGRAGGRLLPDNPAEELPVPAVVRGDPNPIDTDELYLALDCSAVSDPRMHAWLQCGCSMGLRCCEIAQLSDATVTFDDRRQTVIVSVIGKGGKKCTLPGGAGVYRALSHYRGTAGPWFTAVSRWSGRPRQITAALVSTYLARYLTSLGVPATAHQLRHWFGTTSYRLRRDLRATQEAMRHSTPVPTAGYVAVIDGVGRGLTLDVDQVVERRTHPLALAPPPVDGCGHPTAADGYAGCPWCEIDNLRAAGYLQPTPDGTLTHPRAIPPGRAAS